MMKTPPEPPKPSKTRTIDYKLRLFMLSGLIEYNPYDQLRDKINDFYQEDIINKNTYRGIKKHNYKQKCIIRIVKYIRFLLTK